MFGIDFSWGSYQTNALNVVLNNWYQTVMSLYSNCYLFVGSKIGGHVNSHIFCTRPCYFSIPSWRHWFAWQPCAPAQKVTHAETQIVSIVIPVPQSVPQSVAMKNTLFRAIKISEFVKWVERHNNDHVIHMTSHDVTGDPKVAQPSYLHAMKIIALATRWCRSGWVKAQTPISFKSPICWISWTDAQEW